MIYLLLSIAASTLIFIIFKLFDTYRINTLHAIVINYSVACICGLIRYEGTISIKEIIGSNWFWGAVVLGFLFIAIFNVMALTAQKNGLSVASVASKMSVIIPVIFGVYAYNEGVGLQKILGIVLALVAVYLTSVRSKTAENLAKGLALPIILFFGSGIIDTSIKYIETTYLPDNGIPIFSATIFFIALIIGISVICYNRFSKTAPISEEKESHPQNNLTSLSKVIVGGSFLGIVNYLSIYYILKALDHDTLESSTIFTVNNVAIVMLTTLLGLFVFKEYISKTNWIGIALAIVSIALVTFA
ncbi:membrane protein [Sediminibacter sp. Hel_I_10]|uniref:membrane protein n=1 Tax=Sediminibacter sp. Hel_I_10 TaxID=1392490 RepID=UPI00047D3EFC|nr:membrane protein [Sediminibacter sp. Hel_I_10]